MSLRAPVPIDDRISLGSLPEAPPRLGFAATTLTDRTSRQKELWYDGPHLLTGAPTGAGKGRSCVIPTLLSYPGQVVVLDVKGELYQITARRRRALGQRVVKLDPFRLCGDETDALNPLDCLRLPKADVSTDSQTLASLLASGLRFSKDPFWDNSATGLVGGLIHYIAMCEPNDMQHLPRVRDLIYSDDTAYNLAVILDTKKAAIPRAAYQEMASFLQHPERETRPSVLATAAGYFKPFMSDRVADAIGPSTFSLAEFAAGVPMTIYLVLPADRLESHRGLLRTWFGTLMRAIFSRDQAPPLRSLMLLDEAAQLGNFPMLQTAVTLTRSFGVRCWLFVQDLQQLKECYPQGWQTILNNCGAINVFGINTRLMADAWAGVLPCSAEQLLSLPANEHWVQRHGQGLMRARRHDYLLDRQFRNQFDENRFHAR